MRVNSTNPYVGLRPFEVDESILFFGRNEQTLELLQRLHQHHFVAVVGSSGSGKSSLLRAGLIPALKAGYLVDDSDHWLIAIMKPGQSPLYHLAEAILHQANPQADTSEVASLLQRIKEQGADVLLNLLTQMRKEKNINFFLLVDQFEELFRFAMDHSDVDKKDEAIDFVNIMLELSQQAQIPFYTVITMRSDFIGDCAHFFGLPEAMNKSQYLVPRLNRMQLKTVIEGPAKLYGNKLNPTLTSLLLNEIGHLKDELPLLQHALMRIWEHEIKVDRNNELDLDDYYSIGGLGKALSNHADEALTGMSKEELRITKELFQALTAVDENGRKIRRPVLLSQLKELTGATEVQVLHIIDLFIKDSRSFLVISKSGDTKDKVIDISHESLIRQWNTLSQWVDEEGESAATYLQLAEAQKLNSQQKKDLLTGSELQLALEWRTKFNPSATWANRYMQGYEEAINYLGASEAERIRLIRIEKKRRNILRYLIIGVVLSLIIAAVEIEKTRVASEEAKNKDEQTRIDILNKEEQYRLLQLEQDRTLAKNDTLAKVLADLQRISMTADATTKEKLEVIQKSIQADVAATKADQVNSNKIRKAYLNKVSPILEKISPNNPKADHGKDKTEKNIVPPVVTPIINPPVVIVAKPLTEKEVIINYITKYKHKDMRVVTDRNGMSEVHKIGYGFNLDKPESKANVRDLLGLSVDSIISGAVTLNDDQINILFYNDLGIYFDKLRKLCKGYDSYDLSRRVALLDFTFLKGTKQFATCSELIAAVNTGDWGHAAGVVEKIANNADAKSQEHLHTIAQVLLTGKLVME